MTSYPIGSAKRQCSASGRGLEVGDHFVAALVDTPEGMQRRDYSIEGWASAEGRGAIGPGMLVGFWKGVVQSEDAKPKPILDDESMLDLFVQIGEQLASAETPAVNQMNLRLVLTLLMIRRRLLVPEGTGEDRKGQVVMRVRRAGTPRPPKGPPLMEVVDPGLSEAGVLEVLSQLDAMGLTSDGADEGQPPVKNAPAKNATA